MKSIKIIWKEETSEMNNNTSYYAFVGKLQMLSLYQYKDGYYIHLDINAIFEYSGNDGLRGYGIMTLDEAKILAHKLILDAIQENIMNNIIF